MLAPACHETVLCWHFCGHDQHHCHNFNWQLSSLDFVQIKENELNYRFSVWEILDRLELITSITMCGIAELNLWWHIWRSELVVMKTMSILLAYLINHFDPLFIWFCKRMWRVNISLRIIYSINCLKICLTRHITQSLRALTQWRSVFTVQQNTLSKDLVKIILWPHKNNCTELHQFEAKLKSPWIIE